MLILEYFVPRNRSIHSACLCFFAFWFCYACLIRNVWRTKFFLSLHHLRYGIGIAVRWPLQARDFCLIFGILGPSQFLTQRLPGVIWWGVKRPACEINRSFPHGAEGGWECGLMYRQAQPWLRKFVCEPDFGGPGSVPSQWTWDLCGTEREKGKFFYELFGFTLSATFCHWFIPVFIRVPAMVYSLSDRQHSACALMPWLLLN